MKMDKETKDAIKELRRKVTKEYFTNFHYICNVLKYIIIDSFDDDEDDDVGDSIFSEELNHEVDLFEERILKKLNKFEKQFK